MAVTIMRFLPEEDLTPSMLINDISKMFGAEMDKNAESLGLSGGARRILFHLAHNDGVTQLELVKSSHLTAPSVSVALAKMEADGLVRRETASEDKRQTLVYLTEKGRKSDDRVRALCHEVEEAMLKGISENEQETVKQILRKIRRNFISKGGNPHQ